MSKIYNHKHKGYLLQQTSYNWHYAIIDCKTNEWVCHVQYTRKLTEEEARECIDRYLELINKKELFEDESES
jgi:hypothetical protein